MSSSVRDIKGIGEKTEKLLKKLHIETTDDLVHHYPRCYTTYTDPISICDIRQGVRCSVEGELVSPIHMRSFGKRKLCTGLIGDVTGKLFVRWFNMPYLRGSLSQGDHYIFIGTPVFKEGRLMLEQPEYVSPERYQKLMEHYQPVYPLTTGLSNKTLQKALQTVFETYYTEDYLPETVRSYYDLMDEMKALHEIHFPTNTEELRAAKKRIIFDEFFRFFAALELVKEREDHSLNQYIISWNNQVKDFIDSLPYQLTKGQSDALSDIRRDFAGSMTMNRLIQGDVGSGKTMVAMIAMYATVTNGYQAILMAPTEVLAVQHYENFCRTFEPYGIKVGLLIGSMKAAEKRKVKEACAKGTYQMVIGTHALIQDGVEFSNLALAITDEQHRFGVKQRDALMKKGIDPHVLVMSATPIPRTLGIILYRDLDVSIMSDMPASRLPIKNAVVGQSYRPKAWDFIQKQIQMGHQAYVICPMIEESETLEVENVEEYTSQIRMALPPSIRIEALHGKMTAEQKNEIMDRYARHEIDLLVSTTVIEVGIDVPNATVMLIENAERFGLAQLHQLRGRVGRGKDQSYCIFLSGSDQKEAMDRLSVIGHSNNGFEIANEDLKTRGPGEFFGTRQSGTMSFALGDIYTNADILKMASDAVLHLKEEGFPFHELHPFSMESDLNYAKNI